MAKSNPMMMMLGMVALAALVVLAAVGAVKLLEGKRDTRPLRYIRSRPWYGAIRSRPWYGSLRRMGDRHIFLRGAPRLPGLPHDRSNRHYPHCRP